MESIALSRHMKIDNKASEKLSLRAAFCRRFVFVKGPMFWPFLLIIIPLLRSTRIDLHCSMFQTHIGFSNSISV